ncbi:phosphatase PAP2 family protein [Luteimonas sp. MC1782]|uniref:phosphatase PAP2 family protein n=1 Tax=Luteimonas sp. MC1782 TaxID=2760305 RepID=UPI0016048C7A|nr:phosphatase PAP2 family protein [Luteimonas sp. MC1782]MBB1472969.1 phosphatase PAP2 family protein [Luteimonas sp. MC1782]
MRPELSTLSLPAAGARGAFRAYSGWALLPWALLPAVLAIAARQTALDTVLADALFAWEGQRWALRDDAIARGLLHDGGALACRLAWVAVVLAWLATYAVAALRPHRQRLGRLALSVLAAATLLATLKQVTAVHCPWDLVRYGGGALPGDGGGACFPAGHAGAGYAWLALAFSATTPAGRRAGLAIGAVVGLVFGVDQQLRGAHFLSHDLWAAALCWAVAVAVAALWPTPAERAA